MATNISGLFGDITKTPQQYQQDALQGLLVSPAQMGSQGLYQQLVSQMSNAGANIGMGVGGLLGGKTAEQVRDSQINAAMQEVSKEGHANEWEKLDALAKKLADQGLNAEAEKASKRSTELKLADLGVKKAEMALQPEPYRDFYIDRLVKDPDTGEMVSKQFRVTKRWNPETKSYEVDGSTPSAGGGDGGGQGGAKPLFTQEEIDAEVAKRAAAGNQKKTTASTSTNVPPVITDPTATTPQGQAAYLKQMQNEQAQQSRNDYSSRDPRRTDRIVFNTQREKDVAISRAMSNGDYGLVQVLQKSPVKE